MASLPHVYGDAPELARLFKPSEKTTAYGCFKSPESLTHLLDPMPTSAFWQGEGKKDDSGGFRGTRTWQEAVRLVLDGWPEGVAKIAKLRDKINAESPHGPRLVKYSVAGAYPIVARAVAGNPMSMRQIDSARIRRRPVLSLINDMGASCNVDGEVITRRAACTAAIVDAIETAGFSCEVISMFASSCTYNHSGPFRGHAVARVKDAGQPVDVSRLAMGLGHVSFFRRHMFLVIGMDAHNRPVGRNLGYPYPMKPSDLEPGAYVLPGFGTGETPQVAFFKSDEKAAADGLQWLIEDLRKQGCPAFPKELAA